MPLSPALFLSAVHALAGTGSSEAWQDKAPGASPECELIHRAGWSSHYNPRSGVSEWPIPRPGDVEDLRAFARVTGVVQEVPMAGDLYLCEQKPAAIAQAGVVIQVLSGTSMPNARFHRCEIVYGTGEGARILVIARSKRWFSLAAGDRFIRWVDLDPVRRRITPDEYRGRRRGRGRFDRK
ncbi:MAG: hypothetical protein ACT4P7_22750 [Gemmatimonadaceae bacterium]